MGLHRVAIQGEIREVVQHLLGPGVDDWHLSPGGLNEGLNVGRVDLDTVAGCDPLEDFDHGRSRGVVVDQFA